MGSMLAKLAMPVAFAAPVAEIPLFREYPSLKASISREEILNGPTVLAPMPKLEDSLYAEQGKPAASSPRLWIKRDDLSDQALGGNKARKLEFLLADAAAKKAGTLITSGMYGSNHALATAVAAHERGLKSRLILGPQPVTENVKQKLLAFHALGADMHFHSNELTMGLDMVGQSIAATIFPGERLYYIPPGGSNNLGDLGYVNAFLELLDQTGREGLPAHIYVPVGTMGTSVGLLVGSCLGGVYERVRIEGINVADPLLTNNLSTRSQAIHLYKFIRKHLDRADRKRLPKCDFWSEKAYHFNGAYEPPGYGATKPEVFKSIALVRSTENVQLDGTYSGKAMQAMLDDVRKAIAGGKIPEKSLFWLTYDAYDLGNIINTYPWTHPDAKWLDLPPAFHHLFKP